ncbi:MAG: MCE family protein [Planctomycetes bacterium]|nr:MCE family protein [Planctomycetota bacterium]
MQSAKSEIIAGLVVLAAATLVFLALFGVGGIEIKRETPRVLTVRFKDASGLKTYDPVFYAGVEVGKVSRIGFVRVQAPAPAVPPVPAAGGTPAGTEPIPGAPSGETVENTLVEVRLDVKTDVKYLSGSSAMIDKTITGITSVVLQPPPGGVEPLQADELLLAKESGSLSDIMTDVKPLIAELKGLIADLRKLVGDEEVRTNLKKTVENLKNGSGSIEEGATKFKEMMAGNKENIDETLSNLKKVTGSAGEVVGEKNRENLAALFKNLRDFSDGLAATKEKVDAALASTDAAARKAGAILEGSGGNINKATANVKDFSVDLKATMGEIRRHPWWLLHNPDESELESVNLYGAARNFNMAASSLDGAIADLEALSRPGREGVDAKLVEEARATVQASLGRYQEAAKEFWARLSKMPPPK